MKKIILAAVLAFGCPVVFGAPPKDFAQPVERARTAVGVLGMAVTIVEGDTVTFVRGFGVKDIGRNDAADTDTIFPTGSTGNAVTVADLGILVDQAGSAGTTR
jgi:CubicO group peptidase (beta-lactamase class C family)